MKILFFSHISEVKTNSKYLGGNWISSLINQMSNFSNVKIGIAAIGNKKMFKVVTNNITVYSLQTKRTSLLRKYLYNISHSIYETKNLDQYKIILDDFKPDIIHVFGTESEHALHLSKLDIPLIIHIQGIMKPCLYKWFPQGINNLDVLLFNTLLKTIRGSGLFHDYYRHKKLVKREALILKSAKYITGRTHWDKLVMMQLAPNATYFHCDEMIRNEFSNYNWNYFVSDKIIMTTIINENVYKGLDTIFDTALILKEQGINYEWNIVGINTDSILVRLFKYKVKAKLTDLSIHFLGVKNGEDIIKLLLNSNLYIHPSHIDNSPNSICEAMMIGIPVISSDVGGISSLITNNEDGILFPDGDVFTLVSQIKQFIKDKDKQIILSNNSMRRARSRHKSETITSNLINIYETIINNENK